MADVGEASEITMLSLPSPDAVRRVADEWATTAPTGLDPRRPVDEQPRRSCRSSARGSRRPGHHLVEAPLTGGAPGAENRMLTFMVGGDDDAVARVPPVLEPLGRATFHLGPLGLGNTMKLVNSLLAYAATWASLEGLSLCAKAGIPVQQAVEVLRTGGTTNFYLDRMVEGIDERNRPTSFALELAAKDMGLVVETGRALARAHARRRRRCSRCSWARCAAGLGDHDWSDLVTAAERQGDVELQLEHRRLATVGVTRRSHIAGSGDASSLGELLVDGEDVGGDAERGDGRGDARVDRDLHEHLDQLVARQPDAERAGEVRAQLLVVAERREHRDGDHRPVAHRQARARPDHPERGLLHVVEEVGRELGRRELARRRSCASPATAGPGSPGPRPAVRRSSPSSVHPFEQVDRADAPAADEVRERDARAVDLAAGRPRPAAAAPTRGSGEAGRPARMAARDEAAVGVERDPPAGTGLAFLDELVALALAAEAEQLVVLELLVHERVVTERDADVLGPEAGGLVALERGVARHRRRPDDRADERVPARVASRTAAPTRAGARACGRAGATARGPRERG